MPKEFVPFQTFYEDTQRATFGRYAMMTGNAVANYVDFAEMQNHILSMYEGVEVKNSFVLGNDHIDCVDVNTQPSLRQNGQQIPLAKPPPHPANTGDEWGRRLAGKHSVLPLLSEQKKDAYGNVQFCEEGFIPIRRITLDELTRYQTLSDFFNKYGLAGEKGIP
jgi:hypothetical protein